MMALVAVVLILCTTILDADEQSKVVDRTVTKHANSSVILVTPDALDPTVMFRIAKRHPPNTLVRVLYVTNRNSGNRLAFGKESHVSYGLARDRRMLKEVNAPAGELVIFGGSVVYRIARLEGKSHWKRLHGPELFTLEAERGPVEVLWIDIGSETGCTFYLRARYGLSTEAATKAAGSLRSRLPGVAVSVFVRADDAFIQDSRYPWRNPFVFEALPGQAEFESSTTYYCPSEQEQTGCFAVKAAKQ